MTGEITVLAGGWSALEVLNGGGVRGTVIGINDAGIIASVDLVVSMDRLWAEARWPQLARRYAGIADRIVEPPVWLRRSAVQNIPDRPAWLKVFENDLQGDPSWEPGQLNGANSGACGFNLALRLKPEVIWLVGFDMQPGPRGEPYWYPPYPWARPQGATTKSRFADWRLQYDRWSAVAASHGVKVRNVSTRTALRSFKVVTPADYRKSRV